MSATARAFSRTMVSEMSDEMQPSHLSYCGIRKEHGPHDVFIFDEEAKERGVLPRVMRRGEVFDWGRGGPGSMGLARSILSHYLEVPCVSDAIAVAFMIQVVARFPRDRWRMPRPFTERWISTRWSNMSNDQMREDLRA